MDRSVWLLFFTILAACAPRDPVRTAPRGLGNGGVAPATSAPASGEIAFVPVPRAPPAISVTAPPERAVLAEERALEEPVAVEAALPLGGFPGARIVLVLDGDVLRELDEAAKRLTLRDFVREDGSLLPGEHLLAAVVCGADGTVLRDAGGVASVAIRRFFVGSPAVAAADPAAPVLVAVLPRGTVNGEASARRMVLDYVVYTPGRAPGERPATVRVSVEGPGGVSSAVLKGPGPFVVRGVESGDYRFTLTLVDERSASQTPWGSARRDVTVNLDAPVASSTIS